MRAGSKTDGVVVSGQDVSGASRSVALTTAIQALMNELEVVSNTGVEHDQLQALAANYSACIELASIEQIECNDRQFMDQVKSTQTLNARSLDRFTAWNIHEHADDRSRAGTRTGS